MSLRPKLYGLFLTSCSLLASVRHLPVFVSSAPLNDTPDEGHDSVIWSDGAIHEIYNWLQCDDHHVSDASKVPDAASWRLLHETYEHILPFSTKLPPLDQERTSGYHVPIEVKEKWDESGDEEVGIYTINAIPSGTLVWTSTYTAHFDSGDDFRAFARALPKTLACHVLYWVFPRYLQDEPVVCVDLDHGSFMDVCNKDEACNLHFSPEHYRKDSGCQMDLYASRDIAAGEQLLLDHDYAQDMEALVPLGLVYEDQLPTKEGEEDHEVDHDESNDDDEYEIEEEL